MTMQRCSTAPANTTAQDVLSSSSAVRILRRGRCRAPSTRAHAIWRARSLNLERAGPLGGCAKRLRCCLPISNAFSSLTGFDYEDRVVPAMSSSSQPPPPSEAGETDTDAEHPASLREQSSRSTHRAYDRARSDSIAAGLVQQNLPKGDIALDEAQNGARGERRSQAGRHR